MVNTPNTIVNSYKVIQCTKRLMNVEGHSKWNIEVSGYPSTSVGKRRDGIMHVQRNGDDTKKTKKRCATLVTTQ